MYFAAGGDRLMLDQANHRRLVAQLPRRRSALRHHLALVCHRLANWLEEHGRERALSLEEFYVYLHTQIPKTRREA